MRAMMSGESAFLTAQTLNLRPQLATLGSATDAQKEYPRGLFDVIEFGVGLPTEYVINVLKGLFEVRCN